MLPAAYNHKISCSCFPIDARVFDGPAHSGVLLTPLTPFECPFGIIGVSTIAVAILYWWARGRPAALLLHSTCFATIVYAG